jgi:putative phosphoesterase
VLIGVISDTHGLLRPQAVEALRGVAHIVHAGDIGKPEILDELAGIAPVSAVRGNVDTQAWAKALPETLSLDFEGTAVFAVHDRGTLLPAHGHLQHRVVIFGHSHQPLAEERSGVLWLNPGSAGPRRFRLPVTVATLEINGTSCGIPNIITVL